MAEIRFLSKGDIRKVAPAVLSHNAADYVSSKYSFVPTDTIIDTLNKEGWGVTSVTQSKPLKKYVERTMVQKHIVRFRNKDVDIEDKEYIPEIVLVNSHDRTKKFMFYAGIFRLVCENGLIVATSTLERFELIHKSIEKNELLGAIEKVIKRLNLVTGKIDEMKKVTLSPQQQLAFAKKAFEVKYGHCVTPLQSKQLLEIRRPEDNKNDLWTKFNVIQENVMKGGIVGNKENGRKITAKPITNVLRIVKVNEKLWELAESYA